MRGSLHPPLDRSDEKCCRRARDETKGDARAPAPMEAEGPARQLHVEERRWRSRASAAAQPVVDFDLSLVALEAVALAQLTDELVALTRDLVDVVVRELAPLDLGFALQ